MSENIITLIKQVDLISGIYVHILIEVIPGTDFNIVQTIRIFVTCYVQCFRIGVTDGWTQTKVELSYLSKGAAPQEVVSAIRSVYSGQRYIASDIAQQMALSQIEPEKTESPFASLSERELQIMLMITKGQKVNEISEQLNLSPKTVNSYRYRMFSKLNIHGDVELTHLAIRHGLCNAETLSSQ